VARHGGAELGGSAAARCGRAGAPRRPGVVGPSSAAAQRSGVAGRKHCGGPAARRSGAGAQAPPIGRPCISLAIVEPRVSGGGRRWGVAREGCGGPAEGQRDGGGGRRAEVARAAGVGERRLARGHDWAASGEMPRCSSGSKMRRWREEEEDKTMTCGTH